MERTRGRRGGAPRTAANLVNLILPLLLIGGAGYLAGLAAEPSQALASLYLDAHKYGYDIGLVFFGAHLLFTSLDNLKKRPHPCPSEPLKEDGGWTTVTCAEASGVLGRKGRAA